MQVTKKANSSFKIINGNTDRH